MGRLALAAHHHAQALLMVIVPLTDVQAERAMPIRARLLGALLVYVRERGLLVEDVCQATA